MKWDIEEGFGPSPLEDITKEEDEDSFAGEEEELDEEGDPVLHQAGKEVPG